MVLGLAVRPKGSSWPSRRLPLANVSFHPLLLLQLVTYAPFTLFPSPVPRGAFQQALAVQVHYNTLVDRISQDADFLQAALARCVAAWSWSRVLRRC